VEVAIRGELRPKLAAPAPYLVVGGFRLVELAALALCEFGKVVVYVEEAVDLPMVLEGCRYEVRQGAPEDVPAVDTGCVPHLLSSLNLRCGDREVRLGKGEPRAVEPLRTLADVVEKNVEVMKAAFSKLRELGVEFVKGDVRGVVVGDMFIRGKVYEYTYVEGPAVVGPNSSILPFTYVRAGSVLYFDSKVRDEVKNAVFDAYTRKQHGGYVGDSYVASFVNLGAGTTFSNLKNTLGLIKPSYADRGYKKLGPVLGEFVKTAIGTLVYGGRYVGPLSHVYGVVDVDVPPLSIFRGGKIVPMDREKAKEYIRRDLAQFGRDDLYPFYKRLVEQPLF